VRVLHWNERWLPLVGGTEVLLHDLTTEQRRRGHTVAAICDRALDALPRRENRSSVELHRLDLCAALRSADPRFLRRVANEVVAIRREFRPEIVHLHLNGPSLWFHFFARQIHPAPVLVTLHTPFEQLALPIGLRDRVIAEASWVTSVSHALLAELHALAPASATRSSVVWNALSMPDEAPLPLSLVPPTLLLAGRLVPEKGFDVALRAAGRLIPQFPHLRVIVAGDGTERAELERLAAVLLPRGAVSFLGWVDPERMPSVINDATLVIVPSFWDEPFGLIALQAAQMARPVVATRVGGLAEIVVDGKTGYLVERGDDATMAAAVARLLEDSDRAKQFGRDARVRATERFGLSACSESYESIYSELIEAAKHAS
jgi:glycogen(starch) synthase